MRGLFALFPSRQRALSRFRPRISETLETFLQVKNAVYMRGARAGICINITTADVLRSEESKIQNEITEYCYILARIRIRHSLL